MDAITKNIHAITQTQEAAKTYQNKTATPVNFRDILGQVQLSKHAAMRLSDRELSLSGEQIKRVEGAITKANEKGIRDSLVLVDNMVLIVNVKSKTVITAMNQSSDHVFSNIDGAVIV
jgi:flagellar operon protein